MYHSPMVQIRKSPGPRMAGRWGGAPSGRYQNVGLLCQGFGAFIARGVCVWHPLYGVSVALRQICKFFDGASIVRTVWFCRPLYGAFVAHRSRREALHSTRQWLSRRLPANTGASCRMPRGCAVRIEIALLLNFDVDFTIRMAQCDKWSCSNARFLSDLVIIGRDCGNQGRDQREKEQDGPSFRI